MSNDGARAVHLSRLSELLREDLLAGGWDRADVLESGFDTPDEAYELVKQLPGPCSEEQRKCDAKELWDWKCQHGPSVRRVRMRISKADAAVQAQCLQSFRKEIGRPGVLMISQTTRELFCVTHWRTRRTKEKAGAAASSDRADIERKEKRRWTDKIVQVLEDVAAPVCTLASLALDPRTALEAVVGKKRARTLRNRYRAWMKFAIWLQCVHMTLWPGHIGHVLDYIRDVEDGGCAKSFPSQFGTSLAYFERIAGGSESDHISRLPLWKDSLAAMQARLQEMPGTRAARKAPLFSVLMIIALELHVCSEREPYKRFFAFCKLLKLWMALRFDDLQALVHRRFISTMHGLRGVLSRTKTTGAGKRVLEAHCFVHAQASLSGAPWIKEGFRLLQLPEFAYERDYFLPEPSDDWQGTKRKMLSYSYASGLSRQLLSSLGRPVEDEVTGQWKETDHKLLPPPAAFFWTEHSERHWLVSVAAAIGIAKDRRDPVGRWAIAAMQSGEYVLTARQVVMGVQKEVLSALSQRGAQVYDEGDLFLEYTDWLQHRLKDQELDADTWINRLRVRAGTDECVLEQDWPRAWHGGVVQEVVDEPEDDGFKVQLPKPDEPEPSQAPQEGEIFWVSIGRSGFRRLHKIGGCHIDREACASWKYLTHKQALTEKSDKPCRLCWKDLKDDNGGSSEESGSDVSDSSEDSSSSSEEEHALPAPEELVGAGGLGLPTGQDIHGSAAMAAPQVHMDLMDDQQYIGEEGDD